MYINFFDGCRQVESIDPKTTRWPKACQKDYFWVPPGYPFSDFFPNSEKCVISEEYNVFHGSGASKSHHFGTRKSITFTALAQNLVFGIFGTTGVTIECQRVENGTLISGPNFTFLYTFTIHRPRSPGRKKVVSGAPGRPKQSTHKLPWSLQGPKNITFGSPEGTDF